MKTMCDSCVNDNAIINIKNCLNTGCSLANSKAFQQMAKENQRLKAEALVSDPQWREMVWDKASELIVLLSEGGGR